MTSTLGINDTQPRNLEAPRSTELLPEQVRITANRFMALLTEYYEFMNINAWTTSTITLSTNSIVNGVISTSTEVIPTSSILVGKSGSGPSNIIYSILSELDVDQVNADFLSHIQATIASLVPVPSYMASPAEQNVAQYYKYLNENEIASLRALLYQKIVKFFYNIRGSRSSATSFFRVFYNDTCDVYDYSDYESTMKTYIQDWLTSSGMSLSSTAVSAGSLVYGRTPIQAWLPFSYGITPSTPQTTFDIPYRAMVHPVGFKYFVQASLAQGILDISESRMTNARYDYQKALWFLDSTQIAEFANFIIIDADALYNDAFQNTSAYTYADWSNIGSISKFDVRVLSTAASATYTLSVGTYSTNNIVPGMIVTGTSSFGATSSAIVGYNSSSVNTVSGTVTLTTALTSLINTGSTITFSP